MPNLIDISGVRFGRLLVIAKERQSTIRQVRWLCRCDCGTELHVLSISLRRKQTTSCGCFHREAFGAITRTHGKSSTFEFQVWIGIRNRCMNPRTSRYADYGGRGIAVCDRWAASFEDFLADMGQAPSRQHSIDRIDNNAGYSPGNCQWATNFQQARNQRRNRYLTHCGETLCLKDWSVRTGIKERTIAKRLNLGWTVDKAIGTPVRELRP